MHARPRVRERDLDVPDLRSSRTSRSGRDTASITSASRLRSSKRTAGTTASRGSLDAVGGGCASTNLIGLGPFHLAQPDAVGRATGASRSDAIDAAAAFGAGCLVFTTGPATPLDVGRSGRRARSRAARRCSETSHAAVGPVRDRAHELAAGRRRVRAHAPRRHRPRAAASTPACAWRSTRAGPNATSPTTIAERRRPHPPRAGERLPRRHARHAGPARTRRRRHPDRAASSATCSPPATPAPFDLELIGPAHRRRGLRRARSPARSTRSTHARTTSARERRGSRLAGQPARQASSRASRVDVASSGIGTQTSALGTLAVRARTRQRLRFPVVVGRCRGSRSPSARYHRRRRRRRMYSLRRTPAAGRPASRMSRAGRTAPRRCAFSTKSCASERSVGRVDVVARRR